MRKRHIHKRRHKTQVRPESLNGIGGIELNFHTDNQKGRGSKTKVESVPHMSKNKQLKEEENGKAQKEEQLSVDIEHKKSTEVKREQIGSTYLRKEKINKKKDDHKSHKPHKIYWLYTKA